MMGSVRGFVMTRRLSWRTVVALLAVSMSAAFLAIGLARVRLETTVGSFLPRGDSSMRQLDTLARSFGGDPVLVLLESTSPGQLLDQQHIAPLLMLEGQLSSLPGVATVYGPATILNQIAGQSQELLAELSGRRDGLREQAIANAKAKGANPTAAQRAGDQAVAEFDARYGALLVQAMPAGLPTLHNPSFVNSVVFGPDGTPRSLWRFVVPSDHAVAIAVRPAQGLDEAATVRLVASVESTATDARISGATVTVSGIPVLAAALGKEVRREIPLLGGLAVVSVSVCFVMVPWTRRRRRLVPVATTLIAVGLTLAVFGWLNHPLSLGVVAFLSVLLGVGSYYPTYFAQQARRRVVLVVALGTAASFASLMFSPLPFVQDLGMTLSIGVLLSALIGALLLGRRRADSHPADGATVTSSDLAAPRPATPARARIAAFAALGALAAIGWAGLPTQTVNSNVYSVASGLPSLSAATHAESVLGSSGELDVVLTGANVASVNGFDWMRQAQDGIVTQHGDQMRAMISPASMLSFLGDNPTQQQIDAGVRLLPPYLSGAVFRDDMKVAVLSFGVHMEDIGALRRLRDAVLSELPKPPAGYQVQLSGMPIVAIRGTELVSAERVWANVSGIAGAGIVLLVGLRRRGDAARAIAAAAIATGLGLLVIRVAGISLSPATAALGSLTAAIGCEFTVLLASARRTGALALRRSVLLASATSAAGYGVLVISRLALVRDFGVLLACSVGLALAAAACVVWSTMDIRHVRTGAGCTTGCDPEADVDEATILVGASS